MREVIAKTSRTTIRKLATEDAPFIYALMRSEGFLRYIGDRNIHSLLDAENYLRDSFFKAYEERGYGYYLVENERGERTGIAGFLKKEHLENEDFGFAFLPAQMGKGYAYEASRALLKFGRQEFGFEVLDAETATDNKASICLLQKLGFQRLRTLDATDEHRESYLYRLNFTWKSENEKAAIAAFSW